MRLRSAALLLAAAALALTGCSTGGTDAGPGSSPQASASAEATTQPTEQAAGTCTYTPSPGAVRDVKAPASEPTLTAAATATVKTSDGDLTITLDTGKTKCTTNSFASLASQKYYDDTKCHRLTTAGIFVLQCGDPSATGSGGPGYSFADELDGSETYPAGTVAMANAGPNTNGSQFFLVYEASQLPPSYTVFGKLDDASLKTVQAIAKRGTATGEGDGAPKQDVKITSISVK